MTHPLHDDILENLIETETGHALNSDCAEQGHSWQPAGDRDVETIRCARCKWAPHTRTARETR